MSNERSILPSASTTTGITCPIGIAPTAPPPSLSCNLRVARFYTQLFGCGSEGSLEVTREITLPRPREVVWEAIADPERLGAWLDGELDVELREGEEGSFRTASGDERGVAVVEVVPGERLAFHWWSEAEPETRVELSLDDAAAGTRLTVVESHVILALPLGLPVLPARARPAGPVALAA